MMSIHGTTRGNRGASDSGAFAPARIRGAEKGGAGGTGSTGSGVQRPIRIASAEVA
jgi:hypothetical protein